MTKTLRKKSFSPPCPICRLKIKKPNKWVRFHIRYGKHPIVILACKYCNYIEWQLRTKKDIVDTTRAYMVANYMLRYGIKL